MHEVRSLDAGVDALDFTWATRARWRGCRCATTNHRGGEDGLSVVRCLPEALLDKEEEEDARGCPP